MKTASVYYLFMPGIQLGRSINGSKIVDSPETFINYYLPINEGRLLFSALGY